jgi:hypothetical protein
VVYSCAMWTSVVVPARGVPENAMRNLDRTHLLGQLRDWYRLQSAQNQAATRFSSLTSGCNTSHPFAF